MCTCGCMSLDIDYPSFDGVKKSKYIVLLLIIIISYRISYEYSPLPSSPVLLGVSASRAWPGESLEPCDPRGEGESLLQSSTIPVDPAPNPWGDRPPRKAFLASIEASMLCEKILLDDTEQAMLVWGRSGSILEHLAGNGEKADPWRPAPEHVTVGVVVKLSPELDTGLCCNGWNAECANDTRGSRDGCKNGEFAKGNKGRWV